MNFVAFAGVPCFSFVKATVSKIKNTFTPLKNNSSKKPFLAYSVKVRPYGNVDPANKYLNIESGVKNETQYEIFNITGEKIISGTISNSGFKQIPLTGFSEGQYFIRLFSKENIIGVQKFIVLKD